MSEMKNTLVSIYGKSASKLDNIAVRTTQKDTQRENKSFRKMARALVSYRAHSNSLIHVNCSHRIWGWGERTEKILKNTG